jgi:hypothetical protein
MCIGLCIVVIDEEENQIDATQCFIALVIGSQLTTRPHPTTNGEYIN